MKSLTFGHSECKSLFVLQSSMKIDLVNVSAKMYDVLADYCEMRLFSLKRCTMFNFLTVDREKFDF